MALKGTMLLNGADYAPFNLHGVGVFMAHSGQGFTETMDFVVQLKDRVQFPLVNTGLLTEGLVVYFQG